MWRQSHAMVTIVLLLGGFSVCHVTPIYAAQPDGNPILFDMGTSNSPVERGYTRVTADDVYENNRGYGFLKPGHRSFVLSPPSRDLPYMMSLKEHFAEHTTPLLSDGVRDTGPIGFRADVRPGRYRVTVSLGDLLTPMGSISLWANDRLIEKNIRLRHGLYMTISGARRERRWGKGVTGFYDRLRFDVDAPDGAIVIRLEGDDSDYRRLLKLEQAKPKPMGWLSTRANERFDPPYEDIGEPFADIPLLGIEIRPFAAASIREVEPGQLAYDGSSPRVRKAVDAFNRRQFSEAEAVLDASVESADSLDAALAAMWLAGHPDYEGEVGQATTARTLLDRVLTEDPQHPIALEASETLDVFQRALKRHLGRSDAPNHFIENVRACHLFQLAQPGDPLYWKSRLHAARTALQLDPQRWKDSGRTALKWLAEIRESFPENRYATYYLTDEFDDRHGPWAIKDYSTIHRDAPLWACRLHEALNRTLDLSEWWIENKQKPDGSIGGGWGDDVELVGLFGYYGLISDGASPLATAGARRLVNGMYLYSGDVDPEAGYIWHTADSEHSAEWTGDTLPMMMLVDFGNPLWIERSMATAKLMRDLWTGVNAKGHRHFRSNYTGGLGIGGGARANDSAINLRAAFPAQRVLWYNRHPEIKRLFLEWADAWLEDSMSTARGKPRGFIPADVAWEDCRIGGKNSPSWYRAAHPAGTVNYDFGGYHSYHLSLFQLAHRFSGDSKYLEPIRLEAEACDRMAEVRADGNAPHGSPQRIKSVLAQAAEVWEEIQKQQQQSTSQSGDLDAADAMYTYPSVAEACEPVLEKLHKRWPVMTTEASATDRVAFVGIPTPLLIYTGGGLGRGVASVTASVTYRDIGRDFAAFVTLSAPTRLELTVYAFREGDVPMAICPWDLQLGGTYRVCVAPDANEDGLPDSEPTVSTIHLKQRAQPCPVRIAGRTTHLIAFEQTKAGKPPQPAPDLSLWEGDIEYNAEKGYLTVRVHNTGTAPAENVTVVLYEGTPEDGRQVGRATISHLDWARSLTPQTIKLGWRYSPNDAEGLFTAVLDPESAVEEISESNNRVSRRLHFQESGEP